MDNRHSIGSKIQKYRKLKDMTQDELSKQSGIYLSTIKKYESGERNPKPDQLQKIAEALGISVTVFLDYDINTVSDVLSLVMKLNEQSSLKISADIFIIFLYLHLSLVFLLKHLIFQGFPTFEFSFLFKVSSQIFSYFLMFFPAILVNPLVKQASLPTGFFNYSLSDILLPLHHQNLHGCKCSRLH